MEKPAEISRRNFLSKSVKAGTALTGIPLVIGAIREALAKEDTSYPFSASENTEPLTQRFIVPSGYSRIQTESSFGEWLRHLPLKPKGAYVYTFRGKETSLKERCFMQNAGVIDMNIISKSQQCADSVLRLKAEYHWSRGEFDKIAFVSGHGKIKYNNWIKTHGHSRKSFEKFLIYVFGRLGTASMKRDLPDIGHDELDIGDMNIQNVTGGVGHIFLILDIIENEKGKRLFLLGQGATPAQDFHVIQLPHRTSPWTDMNELQYLLKTFSPHGAGVFRRFND